MTMEPSLALQTTVRARLIASPAVTALLDPASILDRHTRPEGERQIIIGEGIAAYADDHDTFHHRVTLDMHIWTREPGFTLAKEITFACREVLRSTPWEAGGYIVHGASLSSRFLRDPAGGYAHAVLSLDATMMEAACSPVA